MLFFFFPFGYSNGFWSPRNHTDADTASGTSYILLQWRRFMDMKRKDILWYLSSAMFVLFSALGLTGLINWWFIPKGHDLDGGFLLSLRHFLRDVHEWLGFFFIILVAVHLWLHKDYIVANWNTYFKKKS
jgi:uncharacterized iron-regulated membrane protein